MKQIYIFHKFAVKSKWKKEWRHDRSYRFGYAVIEKQQDWIFELYIYVLLMNPLLI